MFKKALTTILIIIAIVFLPFAFIFASIYFALMPEKINEWNKGTIYDKADNSNNTGLH
jgi:uncharacterized protein HemY